MENKSPKSSFLSRRIGLGLCATAAFLTLAAGARAATIHVPADQPTIQAAVAAASPGDTIEVAAGSYAVSGANINKALTLKGAQAGVDARNGRPAAPESIITTGSLGVFSLNAANITFDGFKFTNMVNRTIDTTTDADNFTMRNCILEGNVGSYSGGAIQFGGPDTLHAHGLLFEQNLVTADNGYFFYMGHAMDNGTIRNNIFHGDSASFGPFGARTGWLIEGNEFNGDVPGHGPYWGYGFNANLGNVTIQNNYVHQMSVGIGQISVVGGTIQRNRFEDNSFAAFQLWGGEFGTVVSTNVTITCNTIKYNGTPCTSFSDASHGIRLRTGLDASTIHLHQNNITNLGVGTCPDVWAIRQNGSNTADAESNWWGTTDSGVIATKFGQGAVDFTPFLTAPSACAPPCVAQATVYVDATWAGTAAGDDPDGAGPATSFGCDSFATIQGGVNGVAPAGTVIVHAGTYDEDVTINNAGLTLVGAGSGTTNIRGAIGGDGATIHVLASNVTIAGFTITRMGNNPTDWNNAGVNSAGIAIQGQAITGTQIHDNVITGNRTGIDVNNSNGHTIRNNVIDFNRTGLIFRNQTDQMTVVENFVRNNWTVGILFLDASGGTNSPVQSARHSGFNNNDLSANWYGQIVDRQSGGSLPPPGTTNMKNFRGNWFGTTSPVITTANSGEPPYADQIPVAYGGSATAPGGQPDIAGPASANFQIYPILLSGTDTNVETTPGRGTFGFQGVQNSIVVNETNQQGWVFFDDNPGTGTGSGGFETGPGTAPLGAGSAFLTVDSLGRFALGMAGYIGTYLRDITELRYNSYQNNNANTVVAASFQFDVDYDLNDASNTYQGRLVFEPYQSGTVMQNAWQEWDVLAGNWYGTRTSVIVNGATVSNPCVQASPCTTAQILTAYPNLGLRNSPNNLLLFKAGGPWAPGFDGNVDALTIRVNNATAVYDFEPLSNVGTFQFSQANYTVNESQASVTITVTRTGMTAGSATIHYAASDGTASAGSDYAATSGDLNFASGETSKTFTVGIMNDGVTEPDETVTLTLSNPSFGATLGSPNPATLTIADNDGAASSTIVVVYPTSLQGWEAYNENTASATFENGPATPPYGTGSYEMSTGSGTGAGAGGKSYFKTNNYNGTRLDAISSMSYSTWVDVSTPGNDIAPVIEMMVDTDGNGTRNTTLVFDRSTRRSRARSSRVSGSFGTPGQGNGARLRPWARSCPTLTSPSIPLSLRSQIPPSFNGSPARMDSGWARPLAKPPAAPGRTSSGTWTASRLGLTTLPRSTISSLPNQRSRSTT